MKEAYVIGVDYGTLSGRAVVVRVADGAVLACCAKSYAHGVLTEALPDGTPLPDGFAMAVAEDYLDVLRDTVRSAVREAGVPPDSIIGIGVDATSCTMVPSDRAGNPLSANPAFAGDPHAYIKLWKHHATLPQTQRLTEAARERREPFLSRCGNHPSCEWMIPKIMELREKSPEAYRAAERCTDLCDWLTWRLTGTLTRSVGAMGFKSHWSADRGYPSEDFWDCLYPGFGAEVREKLEGPVLPIGSRAGVLCAEAARRLGLPAGIAVAVGTLDGHSCTAALGIRAPGDAALVVGTSNVLTFVSGDLHEIDGICGVVYGGLVPGMFGYDSGQSGTGDMLDWFVQHAVPASYTQEAAAAGISIHALLCEKALRREPWNNPLTVLDWWNGNRNVLCNLSLPGVIWGLTLQTRPEDIYCAMLQAIACGTRKILEQCGNYGLMFRSISACGGIPAKNPFLMQQYADLLALPVRVSGHPNVPALGAGIYAAAAAGSENGGYASLEEAVHAMGIWDFLTYHPDPERAEAYEALYRRYRALHDLLGRFPGAPEA